MEVDGLSGHILRGEHGNVIFMSADQDVLVPSHHHGVQWGVVLEGEMDLTIGDSTQTYARGDVHFVPAGVEHAAVLRAGWKAIYVFERAPAKTEGPD